jgi:exonuclease III
MHKIVSWNYKGLSSRKKQKDLKELIQVENPSIFLLQETKMGAIEVIDINSKF